MDISLIESLARFWLVNCSRGHAYAVMDIGVSYREDVNVVMAVMRETGSRMRTDPVFEPLMLEPLEIAGA
jgi:moderate conductance mechanosensitive channel